MGFHLCSRYAEANQIAIYALLFNRVNAKINVSKDTDRYKHNIVICGIVISGLHCSRDIY